MSKELAALQQQFKTNLKTATTKEIGRTLGQISLPDKREWLVSSSITAISMGIEAVLDPTSTLISVLTTGATTLVASTVATSVVNVSASEEGRDCIKELSARFVSKLRSNKNK